MMFTPILRQMFVVSGAAINIVGHGCVHGFPSVLYTQLEAGDPVHLDNNDISWIGSMVGVVSIVGILISPILMSRFGRQKAHICTTIPAILGWAIFLFANSVPLFLLARVLHGISIGIRFPLAAILVAEYTDPRHRGVFLGTFAVSLGLGVFLSHLWGVYLSWRATALACGLFPLAALIVMHLSPESPSWLISKGRFEEGQKAFYWLRGEGKEQENELQAMIAAQKVTLLFNQRRKSSITLLKTHKLTKQIRLYYENMKYVCTIFKKKEFFKPLIVAVCMLFVFEFGGSHMIPAYGHVILQAVLNKRDPKNVAWQFTFIDLLRTISAFVATYLLKQFKRRVVLFTSGITTILSLVAISVFIYLRPLNLIQDGFTLDIIALSLMSFYTLSYCLGLVPLTWVICGEVFPLSYRSLGSTVSMSIWVPAFVISMKTAPHLFSSVGVEGAFLVYAGVLAFSMINMYVILPETKDRTLQEIENSFKGKVVEKDCYNIDVEMKLIDEGEALVLK